MSRDRLAEELDTKPGAIDQYVKRGLIPQPIKIGEMLRWRWDDVDAWLSGRLPAQEAPIDDPYLSGVRRASQAPPTRQDGTKQGG